MSYTVDGNPAITERTGALTVAGQTVSITQASAPCMFSVSPASQTFPATIGSGSLTIAAPSGCVWSASSDAAWITIIAGPSGSGTGVVNYAVDANPMITARTGAVTVADQIFTVTQAALTVARPVVAPLGGVFVHSVKVLLSCATPAAIIRYTVDGTEPNRSSPAYKKTGVTITNSTTLKAKAFKVKMADSEVMTAFFTVLPPLPLTIATIRLPAGALNARYTGARLAATGGVAPYKWSLQTDSKLPPGLIFNGITGELSGIPTKAGEFAFLMKVTDAQKQTDVQSLNLTIVTP